MQGKEKQSKFVQWSNGTGDGAFVSRNFNTSVNSNANANAMSNNYMQSQQDSNHDRELSASDVIAKLRERKQELERKKLETLERCLNKWQLVSSKEQERASAGQGLGLPLSGSDSNSENSGSDVDLDLDWSSREEVEKLILRRANAIKEQNKQKRELKSEYMRKWRESCGMDIPIEHRKQLLKCEDIIIRWQKLDAFIKLRQCAIKITKERKLSGGFVKRAKSCLELANSVSENSRLEAEKAKANSKMFFEHAKQWKERLDVELQENFKLRSRVYILECQRLILMLIIVVSGLFLAAATVPQHYDLLNWEVTHLVIAGWICLMLILLYSLFKLLYRIRAFLIKQRESSKLQEREGAILSKLAQSQSSLSPRSRSRTRVYSNSNLLTEKIQKENRNLNQNIEMRQNNLKQRKPTRNVKVLSPKNQTEYKSELTV